MKKIFALIFFLAIPALSQENVTSTEPPKHIPNSTKAGDVGLGVMVGTPTAINVKWWTQEDRAANMNVARSGDGLLPTPCPNNACTGTPTP